MQEYEIAILFDPGLEVDLAKAEDQVKKIVEQQKGKITASDNWGKRKLAYPIAKNEYAIYVFYTAQLNPTSLAKIESALNITNEVIRYLVTRVDAKDKAKAELAKEAKEKSENDRESGDEAKTSEKE